MKKKKKKTTPTFGKNLTALQRFAISRGAKMPNKK